MAKAPTSRSEIHGTVDDGKTERSDNPMDWLYDDPMGQLPDFGFGILRHKYRGFSNLPSEFGGRKLRPGIEFVEPARRDDEILASKVDVLLPPNSSDEFGRPCEFLKALDRAIVSRESAILIYATLSYPGEMREHHAWNEARAFAYSILALKRRLPALLILHNPSIAASDNPLHVHLLIAPRRLDGLGFRGFDTDLIFNEGQQVLYDEWISFRAQWHKLHE